MHNEQTTLSTAVREALAVMHMDARPREVARYLKTYYPCVNWTTKSFQTTLSNQREELRGMRDPTVPQLTALAGRLAQKGTTPEAFHALAKQVAAEAGHLGGLKQLLDCLQLLKGLSGLRDQLGGCRRAEEEDLDGLE